jgi:hypothetical protein
MELALGPEYTHLLRTRAYLKSLPNGLKSYPECRGKGAVWKNILKHTDVGSLAGRVPAELAVLPEGDLLGATWMPLVQSFAGHLVLRDCLFASDEAIAEHFRVLDRHLLSSTLYRVLFAVASPRMAVNGASRNFGVMFQGIRLRALHEARDGVELELTYPPMLLPALVGRLYLVAFEVAVELAGGKRVSGKVLEHGNTYANYELTWG